MSKVNFMPNVVTHWHDKFLGIEYIHENIELRQVAGMSRHLYNEDFIKGKLLEWLNDELMELDNPE
ncbi:MAG: hypothetical protein V3T88_07880 [Nitrosomonadaceae bacterium]